MPRVAKIRSKEHALELVKQYTSIGSIARAVGYRTKPCGKLSGGIYKYIKRKLDGWEIDMSHFVGQDWAKGKSAKTDYRIAKMKVRKRFSWEDYFCVGSKIENRKAIKLLIEHDKKQYKCECCTIDSWQGKPIRLELDHINGDNNDFREENLRIICPNCHSQTETHSLGQRRATGKHGTLAIAQKLTPTDSTCQGCDDSGHANDCQCGDVAVFSCCKTCGGNNL